MLPNARYVEYLTPCAYIDGLLAEPFALDSDGLLRIPDRPGLGVNLDTGRLSRFCPRRIEFR
jgi:L-alanine-DL-glutamate epimerase-like enolase superfamily enzyme